MELFVQELIDRIHLGIFENNTAQSKMNFFQDTFYKFFKSGFCKLSDIVT